MVDTTVIFAIIISAVVALAILALVILLFYYHWRNQELLVNFSAFIRENLKLKDKIDKLENENSELADKLDEATGSTRSRPRRSKGPPAVP